MSTGALGDKTRDTNWIFHVSFVERFVLGTCISFTSAAHPSTYFIFKCTLDPRVAARGRWGALRRCDPVPEETRIGELTLLLNSVALLYL